VGEAELDYAIKSNVTINVDSISQMHSLLKRILPSTVSVRLNPEVGAGHHAHVVTGSRDAKFGLLQPDALTAYRMARDAGVKRFGIQMHIGSGILNSEPYIRAMENLLKAAADIHRGLGINFEFIDLGGGFGVPYRPDEEELNVEKAADTIVALFKKRISEQGLGEPLLCIEPGRYMVCDAGVLLTRVNTLKSTGSKEFIGVDAGFNTLIRPAMYDAYHEIVSADTVGATTEKVYDVVGPLCESGDFLARDRKLQETRVGDLLAILNAGAYGFSMSSHYNSRPRPAEILVKDATYSIVREREDFDVLTIGQRIPERLQTKRSDRKLETPVIPDHPLS
jgi:diaminopimelate decarboxylase